MAYQLLLMFFIISLPSYNCGNVMQDSFGGIDSSESPAESPKSNSTATEIHDEEEIAETENKTVQFRNIIGNNSVLNRTDMEGHSISDPKSYHKLNGQNREGASLEDIDSLKITAKYKSSVTTDSNHNNASLIGNRNLIKPKLNLTEESPKSSSFETQVEPTLLLQKRSQGSNVNKNRSSVNHNLSSNKDAKNEKNRNRLIPDQIRSDHYEVRRNDSEFEFDSKKYRVDSSNNIKSGEESREKNDHQPNKTWKELIESLTKGNEKEPETKEFTNSPGSNNNTFFEEKEASEPTINQADRSTSTNSSTIESEEGHFTKENVQELSESGSEFIPREKAEKLLHNSNTTKSGEIDNSTVKISARQLPAINMSNRADVPTQFITSPGVPEPFSNNSAFESGRDHNTIENFQELFEPTIMEFIPEEEDDKQLPYNLDTREFNKIENSTNTNVKHLPISNIPDNADVPIQFISSSSVIEPSSNNSAFGGIGDNTNGNVHELSESTIKFIPEEKGEMQSLDDLDPPESDKIESSNSNTSVRQLPTSSDSRKGLIDFNVHKPSESRIELIPKKDDDDDNDELLHDSNTTESNEIENLTFKMSARHLPTSNIPHNGDGTPQLSTSSSAPEPLTNNSTSESHHKNKSFQELSKSKNELIPEERDDKKPVYISGLSGDIRNTTFNISSRQLPKSNISLSADVLTQLITSVSAPESFTINSTSESQIGHHTNESDVQELSKSKMDFISEDDKEPLHNSNTNVSSEIENTNFNTSTRQLPTSNISADVLPQFIRSLSVPEILTNNSTSESEIGHHTNESVQKPFKMEFIPKEKDDEDPLNDSGTNEFSELENSNSIMRARNLPFPSAAQKFYFPPEFHTSSSNPEPFTNNLTPRSNLGYFTNENIQEPSKSTLRFMLPDDAHESLPYNFNTIESSRTENSTSNTRLPTLKSTHYADDLHNVTTSPELVLQEIDIPSESKHEKHHMMPFLIESKELEKGKGQENKFEKLLKNPDNHLTVEQIHSIMSSMDQVISSNNTQENKNRTVTQTNTNNLNNIDKDRLMPLNSTMSFKSFTNGTISPPTSIQNHKNGDGQNANKNETVPSKTDSKLGPSSSKQKFLSAENNAILRQPTIQQKNSQFIYNKDEPSTIVVVPIAGDGQIEKIKIIGNNNVQGNSIDIILDSHYSPNKKYIRPYVSKNIHSKSGYLPSSNIISHNSVINSHTIPSPYVSQYYYKNQLPRNNGASFTPVNQLQLDIKVPWIPKVNSVSQGKRHKMSMNQPFIQRAAPINHVESLNLNSLGRNNRDAITQPFDLNFNAIRFYKKRAQFSPIPVLPTSNYWNNYLPQITTQKPVYSNYYEYTGYSNNYKPTAYSDYNSNVQKTEFLQPSSINYNMPYAQTYSDGQYNNWIVGSTPESYSPKTHGDYYS